MGGKEPGGETGRENFVRRQWWVSLREGGNDAKRSFGGE